MNEIVHRCRLVATKDDINSGENSHDDNTVLVGYAKAHLEECGDAFIDARGIGDEEYEGNDRGGDTQTLAVETGTEEIGHGTTLYVLCHQLGAATEEKPCEE